MNKQELIEKLERLYGYGSRYYIERNEVLDLAKQLDEPKPVKVPPVVADWLSNLKSGLFGLNYDSVSSEIYDWVYDTEDNIRKLHLAFVYGYEVEEEKRYRVKLKVTSQYLRKDESGTRFSSLFISDFTRNDIEDLGFGWVFDCEGIEIEEVD